MPSLPDPSEQLQKLTAKTQEEEPKEDLPAQTVIELDTVDSRGKRYKGRFLFKVPTIGDQITMGLLKSGYLPQGAAADNNANLLAGVCCYLAVCLKFEQGFDKPEWYDPMNAFSFDPYSELYRRCLDYENRFHGSGKDSRKDTERSGIQEGFTRSDSASVGRKIQAPPVRRETLAGDNA